MATLDEADEALTACQDELVSEMVPAVDDILDGLSPLTQVYFVYSLANQLLINLAAGTDPDDEDADVLEGTVGVALAGCTEASGNYLAALVALGVLPETPPDDAGGDDLAL